ncbi:hypothetical protein FGO68_gene662 [Halteria grandinella]|uniref:Uncharacterized protein n=1 Tax=Halteria grandinella TaxID=5974 RepID=A0A8J8NBA0_HALGN|nr:hypothetical protein FGO68_gene662 [Halteria grandinella]
MTNEFILRLIHCLSDECIELISEICFFLLSQVTAHAELLPIQQQEPCLYSRIGSFAASESLLYDQIGHFLQLQARFISRARIS